jgi:hypothetical protein
MPANDLNLERLIRSPERLFASSAAGIQISGDSGSGKSNLLEVLMQTLARSGQGFAFVDPHGPSAVQTWRYCLSLPPSIRQRVVYVHCADTRLIASINPVAVPRDGADEFTWRARLCNKTGHVAHILLNAWGETDFNSRPVLFKWTTRLCRTAGFAGLAFADIRHFLDVRSELFPSLAQIAPDELAQKELMELREMRPSDRENLIASTKNRFLGFLENPIVEATLGRTERVLDMRQLIQDGAILIVNLESLGVLRPEDQQILACLFTSEILHAVYHTPEHLRVPYFLFIDELPVFASCAPQLTSALTQVRKFKLRIVAAHQGTQFFPERVEDRLLHAFVGQCGVHVYLRHVNPVDAEFFARITALPSIDPLKVKHELHQKQQYQDGHDLITLEDEGETVTEGKSAGGGVSTDTTEGRTWGETTTATDGTTHTTSRMQQSLHDAVSDARAETQGSSQTSGGSTGTTNTDSKNWSKSVSRGRTRTRKQTLVPRLRWRDVVTAVQFHSPEEQVTLQASRISGLRTGRGILYASGIGTAEVQFPLAEDPYRLTPKFRASRERACEALRARRPEYDSPQAILAERERFLMALVTRLETPSASDSLDDETKHERSNRPRPAPIRRNGSGRNGRRNGNMATTQAAPKPGHIRQSADAFEPL